MLATALWTYLLATALVSAAGEKCCFQIKTQLAGNYHCTITLAANQGHLCYKVTTGGSQCFLDAVIYPDLECAYQLKSLSFAPACGGTPQPTATYYADGACVNP